MSTKKATPTHRMTILNLLADVRHDSGVLLHLCRLFQAWLQVEVGEDNEAFEKVWEFAVAGDLVNVEHRDCFTQQVSP